MTKIELKNIKYAAFASQETSCYQGTLYVNGKRFANVSNEGHGGCDRQDPIKPHTYKDIRKLDESIAKEYPKWGSEYGGDDEYDTDLEIVCGNLLSQWHVDKDVKRNLKKIAFVKSPDEKQIYYLGTVAQAKSRGEQIRERILRDYPTAIILNDLPIEEVRSYFS
jgi:hypothetical protein|tara:strand:- start:730 stop:1224 length:495 start_codon:yes stop_codon:yes gene_type:complete